MAKQIVHMTSKYSIGCTFLDWSIHWLAGKNDIWHATKKVVPITPNPIEGKIAHGHVKNHPGGRSEIELVTNRIQQADYDDLITMYWIGQRFTPREIAEKTFKETLETTIIDTWKWLGKQNYKGIFLDFVGPKMYIDMSRMNNNIHGGNHDSQEDAVRYDINVMKPELDMPNTWDVREQLALVLRPYEDVNLTADIDKSYDHYYFNNLDWFYHGEKHIKEIMDFIDRPILDPRWSHWKFVYHKWADVQRNLVRFATSVDDWVNNIVKGNEVILPRLTFRQEAIIQHLLIYKHNLNFKTQGLEKLPNNTLKLHRKLEPNIHNVEDIYDCRKT